MFLHDAVVTRRFDIPSLAELPSRLVELAARDRFEVKRLYGDLAPTTGVEPVVGTGSPAEAPAFASRLHASLQVPDTTPTRPSDRDVQQLAQLAAPSRNAL